MHSFSSIIFCLSLQKMSLESTSNHSIVEWSHLLGPGPHSSPSLAADNLTWQLCPTAAVPSLLLTQWEFLSSWPFSPVRSHGSLCLRERDEKLMADFCFPCIFFIQAVFGVGCIYRHHNCLECFYQRVPGKNGLLLSPPQCFQVSQQSASFIFSKTNQEMEF